MNILQKIFLEHYKEMLYTLHPRESVIENINKMMHCGDSSYGGAMYHCPDCNEWKFVPFRCHSRFCPTCGNMYSIDRTTSMSFFTSALNKNFPNMIRVSKGHRPLI